MKEFENFAEVLSFQSESRGEDCAFIFLNEGAGDETRLTYRQLHEEALKIAAHIDKYASKGDRLLLFYPPGLEFIKAFYGCLYAGVISVPSYPPRMNKTIDRLTSIMQDCGATIILTSSGASGIDKINQGADGVYNIIFTDQIPQSLNCTFEKDFSSIRKEDIAFLQYTSGSTGSPKGVMITHHNILSNQALIKEAFHQSEKSVIVGWLPFYHDMGLIGNILHPVYLGAKAVLMSPTHFLQKPLRWLQAISNYKGTTSGGPNFAYELCTKRITEEDKQALDLSSWSVAFCGAEPVRASTVDVFAERFNSSGFAARSFQPCYGMAEATLLISAYQNYSTIKIQDFDRNAMSFDGNNEVLIDHSSTLVSCGAVNGFSLKIVSHKAEEKQEGTVGEIWIQGDSLAKGYWNKPLANQESFNAYLSNGEGPFFRTGDLGVLKEDQLYIAGRLKDLIIINGRNLYPQDIEYAVVPCDDSLIAGGCAAFSVEVNGGAALIIVCEIDERKSPNFKGMIKRIQKDIFDCFETEVNEIVFIRRNSIAKTTSGKIQRYACRNNYLSNELKIIFSSSDEVVLGPDKIEFENELQLKIYNIVKAVTGQVPGSLDDNFFSLGMDSLKVTLLAMELDQEFNVDFEFVFEFPTLRSLAYQISISDWPKDNEFKTSVLKPYYELSSTQKGIWVDCKVNLGTSAYNICAVSDEFSTTPISRIQAAFNKLLARHEILRTSFFENEGIVYQKIEDELSVDLSIVKFKNSSDNKYHEYLSSLRSFSFDLAQLPLFKAVLVEFENTAGRTFIFVIHHIITDGTSLKMLIEELRQLCDQETAKDRITNHQFKDFSCWINDKIDSETGVKAKAYWSKELHNIPQDNNLPFNGSPLMASKEGASEIAWFDNSLLHKLEQVSKKNNVSLFTTLFSSFLILLHKVSGEKDVIIGTPFSLRDNAELMFIQGPLVNAVFLRNQLEGQESFNELLVRIHEKIISAQKYKFYPVGKIVEDLNLKSVPGKFPVSQVFFNFLNFVSTEAEMKNFQNAEGLDINFYINCYVAKLQNGLQLRLDYRKNLFERDVILNLIEKYQQILGIVANDPDITFDKIVYKTTEAALPFKNAEDATWYSPEINIQENITCSFDLHKEAFVIIEGDVQLRYADFNAITRKISTIINPAKGRKAVIFGPLGYKIPVSMISCVRSGIIYSYLDIDTPEDKLKHVIDDLDPAVILTDRVSEKLLHALLPAHHMQVVCIDDYSHEGSLDAAGYLTSDYSEEDLLYILYTSGTTGNAKGVQQTGKALLHYISSYSSYIKITNQDRISGTTSASYDSFNKEFYTALLNGATYFPCSIKQLSDPVDLFNWLEKNQITVWQITPVLFRYYASRWVDEKLVLSNVRIVKMTGDSVRSLDFSLFKQITKDEAEFIVSLGSTESSLNTINRFGHKDVYEMPLLPVGYPVNRTKVIVVNSDTGLEVDIQEKGELYITSDFLSPGYYNNEELTFSNFLYREGKRFFKSGDLGRQLLDGRIEWLGRNESIVKVNGNRVSLKNLDYHIATYPGITDSYSLVKEAEDALIVSFIVSESYIDWSLLRDYLKPKLSDYNISGSFVLLDKLPVNHHGKIDQRALLLLDESVTVNKELYETTFNATEAQLAEIWIELLKRESIAVKDDFFTIGGTSIKAIKLVNEINAHFGSRLSASDVFLHPTIKGLSIVLQSTSSQDLVLKPVLEKSYYDLTNAQLRIWIQSQLVPYNINNAFVVEGSIHVDVLEQAMSMLAAKHESLRTVFIQINGEPKQKIVAVEDFTVFFNYLNLENSDNQENLIHALQSEGIHYRFDLEKGPLFRTTIVKCADNHFVFFNTVHHIVADGWSMEVFTKDLIYFYSLLLSGEGHLKQTPLTFQFRDYIEWENENLRSRTFESAKTYWLDRFKQGITSLSLPYDRARSNALAFEGSIQETVILKPLSQRIISFSQENKVSVFVALMAVLKVLLFKYSNQQDIVVGTMVAGRERKEWQDQIGMYAKTLMLKTLLLEQDNFTDVVRKISQTHVEALKHGMYPIDQLAEDLKLTKTSSRPMFFNVMIIFHATDNLLAEVKENTGLIFKEIKQTESISKFDLTFNIHYILNEFVLKLEYNSGLFDDATISMLMQRFNVVMEEVLDRPAMTLSGLSMKTALERNLDKSTIDIDFNF